MANGGDLEEFFLRHSIARELDSDEVGPNARDERTDAEDPDRGAPRENLSDKWAKIDFPEPLRRAVSRGNTSDTSHRTGPKGVQADYEEAKAVAQHNRQVQDMTRQAMLQRMAAGVVRTDGGPARAAPLAQGEPDSADELEDSFEDDEEDDFMAQYRAQRLQQLQSATGLPSFGNIREVTAFEFVDEVDQCDPRCFVVVHLYEPFVLACDDVNRHLETLARRYSHVKFLRLQASNAAQQFDPIALPVLNIYRGGDLVTCLVHITDDIGESFGEEDVEWLLQSYDVFEEYSPQREAERQRSVVARRAAAQDAAIAEEAAFTAAVAQAEAEGVGQF